MRYIAGVLSFVAVCLFCGIACALVMGYVFPSAPVAAFAYPSDWRTWPGTIIGILAGGWSARAVLNYSHKSRKAGNAAPLQLILAAIGIGGAIGALAFFWQFSLLQSALHPEEQLDYLDQTVNAPAFGIILGGLAGLVSALIYLHRQTIATRFSIGGGLLVVAFIVSQFTYGYWESRSAMFEYSMQEIIIRCLPMYGSALLWSFCLTVWGLFLHRSARS